MTIRSTTRSSDIENFSAIKNGRVAQSLLESMRDLLAQSQKLSVRGLPVLKLHPIPADMACPILLSAFSYWRDCGSDDALPTIQHIDPQALRPALGWFALADIIDGGDDFVYRLFGSEIAWRFDFDMTGQRVSQAPAPLNSFLVATNRACVAARGPLLAHCAFNDPVIEHISCLLLPWADGAGDVARIMAVLSVRDRASVRVSASHTNLVRFKN